MMKLTQRENLLRLLRRQGYEYPPIFFQLCPSQVEQFRRKTGSRLAYQDYFEFAFIYISDSVPPGRKEIDWARYYPAGFKPGTTFDDWGVGHEPGSVESMHMTRMLHPMRHFTSLEQIQGYPYPDFAAADYGHLPAEIETLHARGMAAAFAMSDMTWEIAWYLRGMEPLLMDMATGDEKAVWLLDKTTEQAIIRARKYVELGVDVFHVGDDVGMQQAMMMSPDFWREWLKPRFARVIRAAKEARPDVIFSYHTCGFVEPVIEDFIEIGVDVLNPVQPECMDFAKIHAQYGDRLSFWGTLGTQSTMPLGTPAEVRRVVHRNLEIAGAQGGLLCTPTHMLEPEVPWENILAYIEACRDFIGKENHP
jgi:uroporphyrinogen decarboxylase